MTIAAWVKAYNAAAWTDGTRRDAVYLFVDASNYIEICKNAPNNLLSFIYLAGGTAKQIDHSISSTAWTHLALSITRAGDAMIVYVNGTQSGATASGLGAWAGALHNSYTLIGAQNKAPGVVWNGWIAHAAIWAAALSDVEVGYLARK